MQAIKSQVVFTSESIAIDYLNKSFGWISFHRLFFFFIHICVWESDASTLTISILKCC